MQQTTSLVVNYQIKVKNFGASLIVRWWVGLQTQSLTFSWWFMPDDTSLWLDTRRFSFTLTFSLYSSCQIFIFYSFETAYDKTCIKTCVTSKLNVKKIAFGNKEHTIYKKMGVSVLLRLFINSIEVCNTAYSL